MPLPPPRFRVPRSRALRQLAGQPGRPSPRAVRAGGTGWCGGGSRRRRPWRRARGGGAVAVGARRLLRGGGGSRRRLGGAAARQGGGGLMGGPRAVRLAADAPYAARLAPAGPVRGNGPGNTRGPRRRDGTLNPSGTAARSCNGRGCAVPRPWVRPRRSQGRERRSLGPPSCAGRAEAFTIHCGLDQFGLSIHWRRTVGTHPPPRTGKAPGSTTRVRSQMCRP